MPAILPGYEYDIFISYRQNDNKRDGWVSNFVAALKDELEATLKIPVSIYFDENPHDGLLESHQVGASLEKKLRCIVFVPIISQTYCDTSSFAWEHEFLPFMKMARQDELGMNIDLANGNVASRVLPVQIHDLDSEDQSLLEGELGGPMRSIKFIHQAAGVNRPLTKEDDQIRESGKVLYSDQINKVANALKEIGTSALRNTSKEENLSAKPTVVDVGFNTTPKTQSRVSLKMIMGLLFLPLVLIIAYYLYSNFISKKATTPSLEKSIAVLPFTNTRPDTDTDYLGFAIANQIIGELDYNKSLTVRPASAIRKYDQEIIEASIVADDLKVNYLLTGNYLMVNGVIRLDIELLEANNNKGIWRDELEVDFSNAFDLQDMVAQKVVNGLDVQFSQQELDMVNSDVSSHPLAYEYYLRSLSYPLSIEGCALAIEMLKKSINLDSTYAPAYTEIGTRVNRILVYGSITDRPAEIPEDNYLKALSLNENQIAALANLSARYAETGRTNEAVATIQRALELNPNNADAHFYLGYIYRYTGMLDESIREMETALSLHPLNPRFRSLGITYSNAGNYEMAYEAIALDRGSMWELGWQIIFRFRNQEYDKVIELADKARQLSEKSQWLLTIDCFVAAIRGDSTKGIDVALQLEQANTDENGNTIDAESSYYTASSYIVNGEREGAIRCLKKAVTSGYFNYPFMSNDHLFESLKEDEEYKEILSMAREKHLAFKRKFF